MCGIVGFLNSSKNAETFPDTVCKMLSMIKHRGPDEFGYFFDEHIAFGVARLSVIDLISGQQPICSSDKRYWIAYNGEVYNYIELREELEALGCKFNTSTDTEVVLHSYIMWGEKAFNKLNGGFAFVIYDRKIQSAILVRDRYGERPLYYTKHKNEWIFASEIKSFLKYDNLELEIDLKELQTILTLWTPLPDRSVFKGIFQVPPGSYIKLHSDAINIKPYYLLDFKAEPFKQSESDAIEQTYFKLSESVRIRLRSDVEVGTYLSGGIDSSIITLLATQYSTKKVKTFSIGFRENSFDESGEQITVSNYLGTEHNQLTISNEDIASHFAEALWHAETPVFRTAFVPMFLLSKQVQDNGIKVALTGEGSDEFFLGYDIYKETILRSSWDKLTNDKKINQLKMLYPYQKHFQEDY